MTNVGETAPEFSLADHLGRTVQLAAFKSRCNVLLLFYPLDWTAT